MLEHGAGVGSTVELAEQHAGVVVGGNVVRIDGKQFLKGLEGFFAAVGLGVFHRQPVVGKGIGGVLAGEFLQRFQA